MKNIARDQDRNLPLQAPPLSQTIIRTAVLAAVIGCFSFAGPVNASPADATEPQQNAADQVAPPVKHHRGHDKMMMEHSPQEMAQHVEERISTLHDKLVITSEQEVKWSAVAQTMRDNETAIRTLIEARHQNAEAMTAIDDLQSYADITQAHADGLKKMIASFQSLYADMPDSQQKVADKVFGNFEGRHGKKPGKKHK